MPVRESRKGSQPLIQSYAFRSATSFGENGVICLLSSERERRMTNEGDGKRRGGWESARDEILRCGSG
jgi:hypothetical protein